MFYERKSGIKAHSPRSCDRKKEPEEIGRGVGSNFPVKPGEAETRECVTNSGGGSQLDSGFDVETKSVT